MYITQHWYMLKCWYWARSLCYRLSKLRILELRENHLKTLPRSMARLSQLERLDIGNNEFSEMVSALLRNLVLVMWPLYQILVCFSISLKWLEVWPICLNCGVIPIRLQRFQRYVYIIVMEHSFPVETMLLIPIMYILAITGHWEPETAHVFGCLQKQNQICGSWNCQLCQSGWSPPLQQLTSISAWIPRYSFMCFPLSPTSALSHYPSCST